MMVRARLDAALASLRVEVTDPSSEPPILRTPPDYLESGRGLQLVDALADHWGTYATDAGKTVWFDLDVTTAEHKLHD